MSQAQGLKAVAYVDSPGGGQVVVRDNVAYVGHVNAPFGTTIFDVSDPANARKLAEIPAPPGTLSHKVRVENGIMLINREVHPIGRNNQDFDGGLDVFDVSRPSQPRHITRWHARGMHRFTFDGRYAYGSPEFDGYVGNVVAIIDFQNPAKPDEVGRWWMPGQWTAGGEKASWEGAMHRCHHPIRMGNRLYVSYWHGGFVILDIEDMSRPRFVSGLDWSPPFMCPTHTALPIPFLVLGRKVMLVADEDVVRLGPSAPGFLWVVDITDETRPVPFASYQLSEVDGSPQPEATGCHQPCEEVTGTEILVAWFAHGLRVVDIRHPHSPQEVGYFIPPAPPGAKRVQSNDVCIDNRGLIYLTDRTRGLHILERV